MAFRSFTKQGNYVGWKVLGVTFCVFTGGIYGMKIEYYMHKAYKEQLEAHKRAQILKEIREEGIVEKLLAREKELQQEIDEMKKKQE
jgi:hypothetical protein